MIYVPNSTISLIELNSWFTKHKNCNRQKSRQLIVIWLKWIDSFQLKILADSVHTKNAILQKLRKFRRKPSGTRKIIVLCLLRITLKFLSSRESKNSKKRNNSTFLTKPFIRIIEFYIISERLKWKHKNRTHWPNIHSILKSQKCLIWIFAPKIAKIAKNVFYLNFRAKKCQNCQKCLFQNVDFGLKNSNF